MTPHSNHNEPHPTKPDVRSPKAEPDRLEGKALEYKKPELRRLGLLRSITAASF